MIVYLVVEGDADEFVLRKIIALYNPEIDISICLGKKGKEYIKSKIFDFNRTANTHPFIVLVDLNSRVECAPLLVTDWLPDPAEYMILRVAVREIETWLLADRESIAEFLSIGINRIPITPEEITNPKEFLVNLARRSRKREIREDMVPQEGSTSNVGKNYNGKLIEFIYYYWKMEEARKHSPSLNKAIQAIVNLS